MRFLLVAGVRPKDALPRCSYFTVPRVSWSSRTLPSVPLDFSKILCVGQLITQRLVVQIHPPQPTFVVGCKPSGHKPRSLCAHTASSCPNSLSVRCPLLVAHGSGVQVESSAYVGVSEQFALHFHILPNPAELIAQQDTSMTQQRFFALRRRSR